MSRKTRRLRKENRELKWELNEENINLMKSIEEYIGKEAIGRYQQNLVWRDIAQMLLAGQRQGRTAKDVLGSDYETFCNEVIDALPKMTPKEKRADVIRRGLLIAFVVVMVQLILQILRQGAFVVDSYALNISSGLIISSILAVVAIAFFDFTLTRHEPFGGPSGVEIVGTLVIYYLCNLPTRIWMTTLFSMPLVMGIGLVLVLGALYLIADARID